MWSLIAVPIVTVLIQEMSSTVVHAVNRGTFTLADWTIMPKEGVVAGFLDAHPHLRDLLVGIQERRAQRRRIARGFQVQDPDDPTPVHNLPGDAGEDEEAGAAEEKTRRGSGRRRSARRASSSTPGDNTTGSLSNGGAAGSSIISSRLERLASEDPTEHDMARELALSIKTVAHDLRAEPPRRYGYEEWVHFTKLIRFSRLSRAEAEALEEGEGLVEWDWIGEDSPMLADITEAEWVLDRLCESLHRYTRRQARTVSSFSRSFFLSPPASTVLLPFLIFLSFWLSSSGEARVPQKLLALLT